MQLGPVTTTYEFTDRPWLASAFGTQRIESITLDASLFTAATHYPNGVILSGIPLGRVTATKLCGPYDASKSNGQEQCIGLLWTGKKYAAGHHSADLYVTGTVYEAKLPVTIDAAGKLDLVNSGSSIRFV